MVNLVVIEPHQLMDSTYSLETSELRFLQLAFANIYIKEGILEDKLYEVDIKQYEKEFNITHDAAYKALISAAKTIATRTLTLKSSLVDKNASKTAKDIIPWVHKIRYDAENGCIKLQWHKDLIPLFNNLGEDRLYSKYLLDNTKNMKSIHSIRLFRLLNKWKNRDIFLGNLKSLKGLWVLRKIAIPTLEV